MGNSSSGIIEAPSLNIKTINIGDRQKGRVSGNTVINVKPIMKKIITSINKVYNKKYNLLSSNRCLIPVRTFLICSLKKSLTLLLYKSITMF